jgi:hypothetical protein
MGLFKHKKHRPTARESRDEIRLKKRELDLKERELLLRERELRIKRQEIEISEREILIARLKREEEEISRIPAPDFTEEVAEIPEDEYVIVTYDYRVDKRDSSPYIKHVTKDRPIRIWIPHADFDVIEYQGRKNEIAKRSGGAVWNVNIIGKGKGSR